MAHGNTKSATFVHWNARRWCEVRSIAQHRGCAEGALHWRQRMKVIIDEAGEIIAKATDDHTLIGGHHRLSQRQASVRDFFGEKPANL